MGDIDYTKVIGLSADANYLHAVRTARKSPESLSVEDRFGALLFAAFYVPQIGKIKDQDLPLAAALEEIQWHYIGAFLQFSAMLHQDNSPKVQQYGLVPVLSERMGPMLESMMENAVGNLGELVKRGLNHHPLLRDIADHSRNDEGRIEGAWRDMAGELILNALSRSSAFIRAGHFATLVENKVIKDGQVDMEAALGYVLQKVEPFIFTSPYLVSDSDEPNLILLGWHSLGTDGEQVSISIPIKRKRMHEMSAAIQLIERGQYPVDENQRMAEHRIDMHMLPMGI